MIGREQEIRKYRDRAVLFNAAVLVLFGALLFRLYYLQIIAGDELRRYSEANRLRKEKLLPARGIIYDRNGKVIVDNRASFDVVMLPQFYPYSDIVNKRLAHALQVTDEDLMKRLKKAKRKQSFHAELLRADVSKDIIAAIEMDPDGFPGVYIEASIQRRYPYQEISSQVLGYVGEVDTADIKQNPKETLEPGDYIGKMGLEKAYDEFLRGANGAGFVEVDAQGRRRRAEAGEKLLGFEAQTEPVPGNNLQLTLDMDVSHAAAEAMKRRSFHGSVVALDPQSGEVFTMLNYPSYDPSLITGREVSGATWATLAEDKFRPLRNRAIQDHYPPGSTFKLFVALGGLMEKMVTTSSRVNCSGHVQMGSRRFHCWKRHGPVDFFRSIKESCDSFYYKAGMDLGVDLMAKYARAFGLGSLTGIALPSETSGLIPDSEWKQKRFKDKWHPGENLSVAIGQGYVVATPLQLVTAYAAIGNKGFLYKPFIVKRIEGRTGEVIRDYRAELRRKIDIAPEVFDAVKEGLFEVMNEPGGTAYWHRSQIVGVSGKTGTSQVRRFKEMKEVKCEALPYEERHHGWFVGYAPRENPRIAVAVIGEHICHGSSAAPVVREVVDAYFQKYPLPEAERVASLPPPPKPKKVVEAPAEGTPPTAEDGRNLATPQEDDE